MIASFGWKKKINGNKKRSIEMKYYYEKDDIICEVSKQNFLDKLAMEDIIMMKVFGKIKVNDCLYWMEDK